MTRAEEHKRVRLKVEVGVRLALEARQRVEEEHAWLEAEEEAHLVEEARLKYKQEEHARSPLLRSLGLRQGEPPLLPSNVPAPLPHISALPLQTLAQNPHPPPSVSLKGRGGPLLLPSVAHAHSPLLPALRLRQGMPPLLPSNVPAPLAQTEPS